MLRTYVRIEVLPTVTRERQMSAAIFRVAHTDHEQRGAGGRVGDRLDPDTRERLERLRRGET